MSVQLWNISNGQELKKLIENTTVNVLLPVSSSYDIDTEVIAGTLPPGLTLTNNKITGTVQEVQYDTVFKFVIRAYYAGFFEDRTLNLVITGPDDPEWQTAAGLLPVGANETYFILDNELIDYQLLVDDPDIVAGDELEFYIANDDGVLPPGLTLTPEGRIQGISEPLLSLDRKLRDGGYDQFPFGDMPSDYGIRPTNGYGSYFFDSQPWDYFEDINIPKKLNRHYPFAVTVSDGQTEVRREFTVYLVGDDFLTTDNILMEASTGVFRADNTNVRTPTWITPRDLGYRRANNNTIIYLDVIDTDTLQGTVSYRLVDTNDDGSVSKLPPGLTLSSFNGELSGTIPYQPAITKEYKFTVNASRFVGSTEYVTQTLFVHEDTMRGVNKFKVNKNTESNVLELLGKNIFVNESLYKIVGINTTNQNYDELTIDSALGSQEILQVFNTANSGQNYIDILTVTQRVEQFYLNRSLTFNSNAYKIEDFSAFKIYELYSESLNPADVTALVNAINTEFGDVSAAVEIKQSNTWWLTLQKTSYTDSIERIENALNAASLTDSSAPLITVAVPKFNRIFLDQNLTNQVLKNAQIGLSLLKDDTVSKTYVSSANDSITQPSKDKTFVLKVIGEIDSSIKWLTDIDLGTIKTKLPSYKFVEAETTVPDIPMVYFLKAGTLPPGITLSYRGDLIGVPTTAGEYTFTVEAKDRIDTIAITRQFKLTVKENDPKDYTDVIAKPLLPIEQRDAFQSFVRDADVFPPSHIYRQNDEAFGIRDSVEVLIYAGIEKSDAAKHVAAAAKNHKRKKYKLGAPAKAFAAEPGTRDSIYEIVYVPVIDPYETTKGKTKASFTKNNSKKITVDSVQYALMDDNTRLGQGAEALPVYSREIVKMVFENFNSNLVIQTRDSNVKVSTDNSDIEVEVRSGQELSVLLTRTDTDPIRIRPVGNTIKTDSDAIQISQTSDIKKYISSIEHMRDNIAAIGGTDTEQLPLWMRTPQDGYQALGYVSCIPLCYCKPGTADDILNRINNNSFNFKDINLEIDRYTIIDATDGQEKHVLFANYQFNV